MDTYQNPLYTSSTPIKTTEVGSQTPIKSKFNLPKDRKIIAIIGLFGFTLILLLISTIVSAGKKTKVTVNQVTPTPIPSIILPTPNFQLIPETLKPSFDSIDQKIKNPGNFLPIHQIDPDIGLN
ncbi:MAG: hypothetical protein WCV93_03275 [Candidatus Shapirobacteria bacterium]|jgi:hypothetical protein